MWNRRFTVDVGRSWADLLTPINYYRINCKGFGLDVVCQTGAEILPGVVVYPQIMALCQLSVDKQRDKDIYRGPPSLVVEIFPHAEPSNDAMSKSQELLAQAGTPEYIASGGSLDKTTWFRLHDGKYAVVDEDEDGFIRSVALPGLWMDVKALHHSDWKQVFRGIRKGHHFRPQQHSIPRSRLRPRRLPPNPFGVRDLSDVLLNLKQVVQEANLCST